MLEKIRFEFLLGAILCVLALLRLGNLKSKSPEKSKIISGIIIYFIAIIFSLLLTVDFDISWDIFINRILKLSAMAFFMNVYIVSPKLLWYFLISTFFAFLKIGQEAFVGKITGNMMWENQGIMRLHGSPRTMFGHPNSLSGKTVTLLPYLWVLFGLVKKYWKVIIIVQVVFSINIILFTGSRTGYLATCFLFLAFFIQSKSKIKIGIIIVIASVIVVYNVPVQYKERFLSSFSGEEAEGKSKDTRIGLLRDSIQVFVENPFGVGIGCFVVIQANAGRNEQGTHNLYTQLLSEIGIQGFLAFMYFMYTVIVGLNTSILKLNSMINFLNSKLINKDRASGLKANTIKQEIITLTSLKAVCSGTLIMVFMRAILGFFGHDLYEIYWWIAAGLSITVLNLMPIAEKRMKEILLAAEQV
ncbi:O-antigen ligase family protein [Desulfosarcina variabilis]|uniref:O-antigen ligase family protein n=1 Tax=Desulfosarcina variabilis TaxID=2300 RepID=UPI003AFAE4F7